MLRIISVKFDDSNYNCYCVQNGQSDTETRLHMCTDTMSRECRTNMEKKLTEESMKMSNRIVALNSENCITHSIDIGRN